MTFRGLLVLAYLVLDYWTHRVSFATASRLTLDFVSELTLYKIKVEESM